MQIGLFGILTIIFVVCKLTNIIAWSWWLVLLPMYGGAALFIVFMLLAMLLASAGSLLTTSTLRLRSYRR